MAAESQSSDWIASSTRRTCAANSRFLSCSWSLWRNRPAVSSNSAFPGYRASAASISARAAPYCPTVSRAAIWERCCLTNSDSRKAASAPRADDSSRAISGSPGYSSIASSSRAMAPGGLPSASRRRPCSSLACKPRAYSRWSRSSWKLRLHSIREVSSPNSPMASMTASNASSNRPPSARL